jgi:hypothetical protein
MSPNSGKTVREILRGKKGDIKSAALDPGSPSWDDIMDLTWEEVVARAKRRVRGFQTFKKLLSDAEYDK